MEKDKKLQNVMSDKDGHPTFLPLKLKNLIHFVQRLVTATYIVSDFILESDLIKKTLREESLALLSDIFFHEGSRTAFLRTQKILSLIAIAHDIRLISPMNTGLLQSEYVKLLSFIQDSFDDQEMNQIQSFFSTPSSAMGLMSDFSGTKIPSKGNAGFEKNKSSHASGHEKGLGIASEKHLKRRELILGLLSRRSPLSIKDIAFEVKGYSEKTIQRELIAMIRNGVLKRDGARRWSKYALANHILQNTQHS